MMTYTTLLPLILGLNEALKKAGMPPQYAPLVNLFGGMIGGAIIAHTTGEDYLTGAVAGATD